MSVTCICGHVAVSPVGLSGYGLAAGEVAEHTWRRLSCLLLWSIRSFLEQGVTWIYNRDQWTLWNHMWLGQPARKAAEGHTGRNSMGRRGQPDRRHSIGNTWEHMRRLCFAVVVVTLWQLPGLLGWILAIWKNILSHTFIHSFASEMLGHFIDEIKMLKRFQYLCSLLLFSLIYFFF